MSEDTIRGVAPAEFVGIDGSRPHDGKDGPACRGEVWRQLTKWGSHHYWCKRCGVRMLITLAEVKP
jgi:hypothetical protein